MKLSSTTQVANAGDMAAFVSVRRQGADRSRGRGISRTFSGAVTPLAICRWLLVGLLAVGSTTSAASSAPPNIILIMTDDQGYGEISAHGNPILRTPHLDRLHAASARFTDFTVSPTCAPTRAALMTGRHEFRSGVTHTIFERERLSLQAVTIAQVLQSAGYATGIFGKWHLGDEAPYQPGRRGFEETFIHGGGGIGQTYPGSCGDAPGNRYFAPTILHNGRFVTTRGYCTDVFFRQAEEWIRTQRGLGRPFFAYLTPNAPHDPFISPGREWETPYLGRGLNPNAVAYYAMIANIDANIGRLLESLERAGLERETLVIFLTDNGHSEPSVYNAGLRAAKGTVYRGGVRVPSFWRYLGRWEAGDRQQPAAHVDIFPTLAELAGARIPEAVRQRLEGRSLVPVLKNPRAAWADRVLINHLGRWKTGLAEEARHTNCAIRNSRFKLVNNAELYDLEHDPAEAHNVASNHPAVVDELRATYDEWWAGILPGLENELVRGPVMNPFKVQYWAQFGGGPAEELRRRMDPEVKFALSP